MKLKKIVEKWYTNGRYISATGIYWYRHGKLHRTNGPAVEYSDGTKWWCINGKMHRSDGPACIKADGHREWWLKGKCVKTNGPKEKMWHEYVSEEYWARQGCE